MVWLKSCTSHGCGKADRQALAGQRGSQCCLPLENWEACRAHLSLKPVNWKAIYTSYQLLCWWIRIVMSKNCRSSQVPTSWGSQQFLSSQGWAGLEPEALVSKLTCQKQAVLLYNFVLNWNQIGGEGNGLESTKCTFTKNQNNQTNKKANHKTKISKTL